MEENISNKNNIKNIIVGIVIFVFLIVISIRLLHIEDTSPNDSNKVNDTVNVNGKSAYDKMLNYMNKKYDDKFTFKSSFGGGAGADTKQMIVSSKKYPEYDIWVEYSYEDEIFNDNYTDYNLKSQVETLFLTNIEDMFNCRALVTRNIPSSGSYAQYDSKTTVLEYLNTPEQNIGFSAVISGYDYYNYEQVEKELTQIFGKYKANIYGSVYFIESEQDVNDFFDKELTEQQKYTYVRINKMNSNIVEFDWK